MKFTWGHGITIGFALFVVYILYFVFTSFGMSIDLVSEDYYAQEVKYQNRIDQERNALDIKDEIHVSSAGSEIKIAFPEEWKDAIELGSVHFFRPSNVDLDVRIPLRLDENAQLTVPLDKFVAGRYEVQLYWEAKGKEYFVKKDLYI